MPTLFEPPALAEIQARLQKLQPAQQRLWGTMSVAQAVAHCSAGVEMALGDIRPPRVLIGRLFGGVVKRLALGNDAPMKRNSPTSPELVISDERDLDRERTRLAALLERFCAGGHAACTTHPHPFFGAISSSEWSELMYKHVDHHLRQFGV